VRAVLDLLGRGAVVRGLAHITGGGLGNLLRLNPDVGFDIDDPLPVPGVFGLVQQLGEVSDEEMWDVFNMGCGFVVAVAEDEVTATSALLASHHPGARRIGSVTGDAGRIGRPA
jgi:phosphoribosylformylglycinamidine cyclo-ligase